MSNANKYYNGAYEIFGYFTRDDELYLSFRNSLNCTENNSDVQLKNTIFYESDYPEDNIIVAGVLNMTSILGYIPGIAVVPGFINILRGLLTNKKFPETKIYKEFKYAARVKGVLQIFGLGIFTLPFDVWVTRKRKHNPPDLTDLFHKTQHIEEGAIPNLDILRKKYLHFSESTVTQKIIFRE